LHNFSETAILLVAAIDLFYLGYRMVFAEFSRRPWKLLE